MHTYDKPIERQDEDYDYETDQTVDAIQGILADMQGHSIEMWYRAVLMQMYVNTPNFSELSRRTGIPRTSISQAVDEARQFIKQQLDARDSNNTWSS